MYVVKRVSNTVRISSLLYAWHMFMINFVHDFQSQMEHPQRHPIKFMFKISTRDSKVPD